MSWLSLICFTSFMTFLVIWASPPQWDRLALEMAAEKNITTEWRIQEAWKATIASDTQLHEYYNEMKNTEKEKAERVLRHAYDEVNRCVYEFYMGWPMERFTDCMRHATSIHLTRLKNIRKATDYLAKRAASGASRLKIWH
ncbi:hypothetical protein KR026_010321 [Drosophila bipectinata]|nr:hypothetical protein KR026_010321 [Drosophila bipectinata]